MIEGIQNNCPFCAPYTLCMTMYKVGTDDGHYEQSQGGEACKCITMKDMPLFARPVHHI